jgi:hypothetical protein
MSDELLIERIREAMRAEVADLVVPGDLVARVTARRRMPALGWLAPALAVAIAALVAVVAVTSLSHRPAPAPAGTASIPRAARGLAAHLAVLRRPQRPADVLPRWAVRETESLTDQARVIGGLSRLVGSVDMGKYGSAKVYLIVQVPPRFPVHRKRPGPPLLSPRLGDAASIAFLGPFREEAAINGPTVAAGGDQVAAIAHGLTADPGQVTRLWGAVASIVPDGVARVTWVFGGAGTGHRQFTVHPRVRDNVAIGRERVNGSPLTSAVWYARDGRVIGSFGEVSGPAAGIAPLLVKRFGIVRSRPRPAEASAAVSSALSHGNPYGLIAAQARLVSWPQGSGRVTRIWVIPGRHGIGLQVGDSGAFGAVGLLGPATPLTGSMFMQASAGSGLETITGLVPDGYRSATVLLKGGGSNGAPVVDNVYSLTVPSQEAKSLVIRGPKRKAVRYALGGVAAGSVSVSSGESGRTSR